MAGRDRENNGRQPGASNRIDPENVVRFPGDWVGPSGDLVPLRTVLDDGETRRTGRLRAVEPTKVPDLVPPAPVLIDGDAFWGESSGFVQQAVVGAEDSGHGYSREGRAVDVAEPAAGADASPGSAELRRPSPERQKHRRRPIKVAAVFVCLAVASFAADAGLFSSQGAAKKSSAEVTQSLSTGSGRTVKNASATGPAAKQQRQVSEHRSGASKHVSAVVRESVAVKTVSRPAGRDTVTDQSGQRSGASATSRSGGDAGSGVVSVSGLPDASVAAP